MEIADTTSRFMFSAFYQMQQTGRFCDVEMITATGGKFLAHSCILAAASSKLAALVEAGVISSEKQVRTVSLPDEIRTDVFELLLRIIYDCKFSINVAQIDTEVMEHGKDIKNGISALFGHVDKNEFGKTAGILGINVEKELITDVHVQRKYKQRSNHQLRGKISKTKQEYLTSVEERGKEDEGISHPEDDKDINTKNKEQFKHNLECAVCGRIFRNKKTLQIHIKHHNNPDEVFLCSVCGNTFKHRSALERHHVRCHASIGKEVKTLLKRRKNNFVAVNKRISCTICNKSFTNNYVMQLHMTSHTGEELYSCSVCGKKFPYRSSLSTHRLIHSGVKAYICSVCGKSFTQKIHAKEHESQHTGQKRYNCNECNKYFAHKSGLTRHMSDIHHGNRPFVCETCGRSFPRKTKLMEHNRIHTGEKPYICGICGVSYKANRSLKIHKKSRHGIVVPNYQVGISTRNATNINIEKKDDGDIIEDNLRITSDVEVHRNSINLHATGNSSNKSNDALLSPINIETSASNIETSNNTMYSVSDGDCLSSNERCDLINVTSDMLVNVDPNNTAISNIGYVVPGLSQLSTYPLTSQQHIGGVYQQKYIDDERSTMKLPTLVFRSHVSSETTSDSSKTDAH